MNWRKVAKLLTDHLYKSWITDLKFNQETSCSKCRTRKTVSRTILIQVQLGSYVNMRHRLLSDQCLTINGHDLISYKCRPSARMFKQGPNYFINVIKAVTIPTNLNLEIYKLTLINVISFTSKYIYSVVYV